jgi:hypothetical protein
MAYISGISIRDGIHTDFSTGISGWNTQRTALTGEFTRQAGNVSGRYGEFSKDIQEYNRKIDTLSGAWNDTGMFLTPYNAGFRYTGTGDFNKWDTYSVSLDGVDDYIDLGSSSTLNPADITVSMWIKPHVLTSWDYLFTRGRADYVEAYRFEVGATDLYCAFGNGSSNGDIQRAHGMSNGNWYHVAVTYDGSTAALYKNGSRLGATQSISIVMEQDSDTTTIGQPLVGAGSYFDGEIDEVAIWDSALSAAQILAIYNGGTPQSLAPYSPVAWWRMGDGTLDDGSKRLIGDQVNPTLGSDLVTNGNFATDSDWIKGAGWTISGGVASIDGSQGGSVNLQQDAGLVTDEVYEVTFDVVTRSAGQVRAIAGGNANGTWRSSTGTFTEYLRSTNNSYIYFKADSSFNGSIDNVSVKKINGYAGQMINMTASDIVADTP